MSKIQFLSYLRSGFTSALTAPFANTLPADATAAVSVRLTGDTGAIPGTPSVHVRGPGHVIGLPSDAVVRTEPASGESGASPDHFAAVEISPATLPWAVVPAAPDKSGHLPPWLVLVVVRADRCQLVAGSPCQVLRLLPGTTRELPDLRDAWAWAHVQVQVPDGSAVDATLLAQHPEAFVARLICPRRLEPDTRYVAALVPAFQAGRQAGLGQAVTATTLAYAWNVDDASLETSGIDLPAYHAYGFVTEQQGDFEDLAKRISPVAPAAIPAGLGRHPVSLQGSSTVLGTAVTGTFQYHGALCVTPSKASTTSDFAAALTSCWTASASSGDPVVTPPAIGAGPAGADGDPVATLSSKPWFAALNQDPSLRSAAAVGATIVRRNQEALVASAWEQVADLRAAAQAARQATLAAEVGRTLAARARKLGDTDFLQWSAGAHAATLPQGTTTTAASQVGSSTLPAGFTTAAMRRAVRPASARGRAVRVAGSSPAGGFASALIGAALGTGSDPDLLSFTAVSVPSSLTGGSSSSSTSHTVDAKDQPLATLANGVKAALKSRRQIVGARLRGRVTGLPGSKGLPRSLHVCLRFLEPLAPQVARINPELILPGVDGLPDDGVVLIDDDPGVVAAILAGATDAMARELFWRGLPADTTATMFRDFWPALDTAKASSPGDLAQPMTSWTTWPPAPAAVGIKVLLIKADLLKRYPETRVYALDASLAPRNPSFAGQLAPGIAFVGFQKGATEDWKTWVFVLEQPMTGIAFGLDADTSPLPAPTLDGICWGHLGVAAGGFVPAAPPSSGLTVSGLTWGAAAASQARLTLQKPIRVLVAASTWIS